MDRRYLLGGVVIIVILLIFAALFAIGIFEGQGNPGKGAEPDQPPAAARAR